MSMHWSYRWTDDRKRDTIASAELYLYHYADADYDGDDSTMVKLGGAHRDSNGRYTAYVAYSFAPKKSDSQFYGDQTATRNIDGDFATFDEAATAVQALAAKYFTRLAKAVKGLKK